MKYNHHSLYGGPLFSMAVNNFLIYCVESNTLEIIDYAKAQHYSTLPLQTENNAICISTDIGKVEKLFKALGYPLTKNSGIIYSVNLSLLLCIFRGFKCMYQKIRNSFK